MKTVHTAESTADALRITGPGVFGLQSEVPIGHLGTGDLLLTPLAVGLCATDLELLDGSMVYLRQGRTSLPLTPGHEWVARVAAVGPGAGQFAVGDTVVGECSIGCEACPVCQSGAYHRCEQRRETGILGKDGALATRMVFPARAAHRVPDGVALEDAALTEPAAVAFRAVQRCDIGDAPEVLVVGAGPIGALAVQILQATTAARVEVAEISEARLAAVQAWGAKAHHGSPIKHVIEATGSPSGIKYALSHLASGGRLVLVGLNGSIAVPVSTDEIVVNDQELIGSLGSPGVWPDVLALLESRAVRPSLLVSHQFALEDVHDAVALARRRDVGTTKILIRPVTSHA